MMGWVLICYAVVDTNGGKKCGGNVGQVGPDDV